MITITAPAPGVLIRPDQDIDVYIRANAPALERAVVSVELPGAGRTEVVWSGMAYTPPYTESLITPFTDGFGAGFHFKVRRTYGWPDGPVVRVVAYDVAGGEAIL